MLGSAFVRVPLSIPDDVICTHRIDLILICLPEFLSALPMSDAYYADSMGQEFDLQSGEFEDLNLDGKKYIDAVAALTLLKCSPTNVSVPGYEDDIESDDTIFDLLVSSGSVKSIEDIKRAGDVKIGSVDKDGIVLGTLHITGVVLTNNYTLTVKDAGTVIAEGKLDSKIEGAQASIFILLSGHDHKYQASLGEVEVISDGNIGNVEVSDNDLGDSEVKLIADSFKSHYTTEVTEALWEEFHVCLHSALGEIDISEFIKK
ncbi:unnamed protein product [Timema podura]|uniref:Uncharacterized protein n=1 Tax=Timema podura TaxID=61482 RepID=A0ABN7PNE7_TIMPD|nr:unnamed protein product [Timema podura]